MPVLVVVDYPAVEQFIATEINPGIGEIAGPAVTASAKKRALVRTGKLRDSIGWSVGSEQGEAFTEIHAIFYDLFQERPARQIGHATRALMDALEDVPALM